MPENQISEEQKIQRIICALKNNALGDIKRASNGGSKMGAFILCSCLIDAMSGFVKGCDTNRTDYIDFVSNYLNGYNKNKLYSALRCKLVHSYSEGGAYTFIHEKPELHLLKDENNKIVINLENFIEEIQSALDILIEKLQDISETQLRAHAITRFDNNGIIEEHKNLITNYVTVSVSGSNKLS